MQNLSTSPTWTIVFCSLHPDQKLHVFQLARDNGYALHEIEWYKRDLKRKSHQGGFRQPRATESIVVVYKFAPDANSHNNFKAHYALLARQSELNARTQVVSYVARLFYFS